MKNIFFLLILVWSFTLKSNGQDSERLIFKKQNLSLPINQESFQVKYTDSSYFETIINIGNGKYFYIKQQREDTTTIESGQLALYKISNKFYLMREGIWVVKKNDKKILFDNLSKLGLLDEIQISLDPVWYDSFDKKAGKKQKRADKRVRD